MTSKVADASFRFIGDVKNPDEWTVYFGIFPTQTSVTYKGNTKKIWILDSGIISDDLDDHVRELIKKLKLPRNDLFQKSFEEDLEPNIFCYWDNELAGKKPSISRALMGRLLVSGVTLDIDQYPQEVIVCEGGVRTKVVI